MEEPSGPGLALEAKGICGHRQRRGSHGAELLEAKVALTEQGRQLLSKKLLGYSWASGVAGQDETGQTDTDWPLVHLPSVCLSLAWSIRTQS